MSLQCHSTRGQGVSRSLSWRAMNRSTRAAEGSPAPAAAAIEPAICRTAVLIEGFFGAVAVDAGLGAAAIAFFELEA